jgi:nucleotide-binding universal stress UspA family protein
MAAENRYLVGTDFSPSARRALAAARALARRAGASLTIVHVRPGSDLRAAVLEERGDLLRGGRGNLGAGMKAHYLRRIGAVVDAKRGEKALILSGAPDIALCKEARRGYDLLVMGNHGHGAVSSLFLGATTQRVLARSPIPVVVVPSKRRR